MTDGLNNKIFVLYSSHGLNNEPFNDWTVFNHLNTELVCYSDPHFICIFLPNYHHWICLPHSRSPETCTWLGTNQGSSPGECHLWEASGKRSSWPAILKLSIKFYLFEVGIRDEVHQALQSQFSLQAVLRWKVKNWKLKFSNHLNTGQVWYLNGPNISGCIMVWFLNGGLISGQKMSVLWLDHFCDQAIWKPDKKVTKKLNVQISGVH